MPHFRMLLVVAIAVVTTGAVPAPIVYSATLSGLNEVGPNASPGLGSTVVIVDPVVHSLRVITNFSGLTSNTTASHIHCCTPPGANAIVATTTPSFVGFPLGVTTGAMDQTYDMTQLSTWNPAFVTANGGTAATAETALLNGLAIGQAYLNVHTVNFPGGELRGNLALDSQVPVMPTVIVGILALLLIASGWFTLRARRNSLGAASA